MMDLAELVAGWIYSLQIISWQQWILRLIVLSSGVAAVVLCGLWFPLVISMALLVTALLLVLASVVRPDSHAPLSFVAIVALWWLAGGAGPPSPGTEGGNSWRWLSVAAVVAVFHQATAFSAAAPSYARITGRAAAMMSRGMVGFVAASVAAGMVVLGLTATLPDGVRSLWWVAAGALAVGAVAVVLVDTLRPSAR